MLYKILDTVKNIESNLYFDVEANTHFYVIDYKKNTLIMQLINEYRYDGENWGEIECRYNKEEILKIECSEKKYINFLINIYQQKILIEKYDMTDYKNGMLIKKININYVEE